MTIDLSALTKNAPPFLQPKLYLFLSVDIVGSTAYKQTSRTKDPSEDSPPVEKWVTMITHFYRDFSTKFLTECQRFDPLYKGSWTDAWIDPEEPILWKVAGDELIYRVGLKDHRHSVLFISAWVAAIKEVRKTLVTYSNKLNLKASAWLAGFPVNNTEVILGLGTSSSTSLAGSHIDASGQNMLKLYYYYRNCTDHAHNDETVDYIGPSLDIGFRLGGYATTRRLICSVELAWLICRALEDKAVRSVRDLAENCEDNASVFHISERQALKGVLDGVPYPIIWIDTGEHKEFNKIEDIVFSNKPLDRASVIEYCKEFIQSCNVDYLTLPFINGTDFVPNEAYQQKYATLLSYWEKIIKDHEDATTFKEAKVTPALPDTETISDTWKLISKILTSFPQKPAT